MLDSGDVSGLHLSVCYFLWQLSRGGKFHTVIWMDRGH